MTPRGFARDALVIAAVAVTARVVFRAETGGDPFFRILAIDGRSYVELATRFAGGDWLWGTEPLWFAPLYPLFLGGLFRVFGAEPDLVRLLQHVLGVGTAILGVRLGGRFSPIAGRLSGGLLALSPVLVFYENQLYYPSVAVFATALFLLSLVERRHPLLTGLAFGVLGLLRSNALVFLPVGAWWLGRRTGLRSAGWFVAGTVAVLAPVLLRNGLVAGTWTLTVNGGMIFATGFGDEALGGRALERRPEDFGPGGAFHREAERWAGRPLGLAEASRIHRDRTLSWIRNHPSATGGLTVRKLGLLFSAREIDDNLGFPLARERARSLAWWPAPWAWFLVLAGAGAGLAVRRRGRTGEEARLLCLYSAVYCASLLLFFVNARYRLPLVVPAAALAGLAGAEVWAAIRRRVRRPREDWLLAATVGAVCLILALRDPALRADPALSLVAVGGALQDEGRSREALAFLDRAIRIDPRVAGAHQNRALALRGLGRPEEALAAAETATRLDERLTPAWMTRGTLLAESGRLDEAVTAFRRAAALEPENPGALFNLAQALAATGRLEEAVNVGRRAERLGVTALGPRLRAWEEQLASDAR